MKLLITGATGLVGQALVQEALKQNHSIHFLTTRKHKLTKTAEQKGFYWNPTLGEIDMACFEGVDTIIHLAGATVSKRWTVAYQKKIYDSRIQSTELLYNSLRKLESGHKIKAIVSASAIGCYPSHFTYHFEEDAPISDTTFMEKVVKDWEAAVDQIETLNIAVSKLRIGLVLSRAGGVLKTLKIPTKLGLGAAFGTGKQGQSWIHISDLVHLFLKAATEHWEGVYNAVSPNPVNQKVFMRYFAKALGSPYFLPPIPAFVIRLGAGAMSVLILDSHWVSAKKIEHLGFVFQYPSLMPALKNIFSSS